MSFGAAWFVSATEEARARTAFQADAQEIRQQIQSGLNAYIEVIRAGTALLAASNEINFTEFRAFVAGLQLRDRYPGSRESGFHRSVRRAGSPIVPSRHPARWRHAIPRLAGRTDRPEHRPVIFFEPRANLPQALLGFDMSTDPILLAAMDRARDTGQPAASDTLQDVRPFEATERPDLVLYITGLSRQGAERDRSNNVGVRCWAGVRSVQARSIASARRDGDDPFRGFRYLRGTAGSPAALIYRSTAGAGASRFSSRESVQVAGRNWRHHDEVVRGDQSASCHRRPRRTLLVGLLLSLLVFLITRGQVRAWETAARHEAELRASEQALRQSELELHRMVARERNGARAG